MKKHILLILPVIFIFAHCSNKGPVVTPTPSTNGVAGSPILYDLTGLHDITLKLLTDTVININVSVLYRSAASTGILSLTPYDLPRGVTVTPAAVSAAASFDTTFQFHFRTDSVGIFPVPVRVSSAGSNYTYIQGFNLFVTP